MKFVTLQGSPKPRGNTAALLQAVEAELSDRGVETERFDIPDRHMGGCLGCGACQKDPGAGSCRQEDGCSEVFEAMRSADGVIYASPLYGWGFTGQMKLFLDRHFSLVNGYGTPAHRSALAGRRSVLLVTCAGPEKVNSDLIKDFFDRFCHYAILENRGKYVLPVQSVVDAERVRATVSAVADSILA